MIQTVFGTKGQQSQRFLEDGTRIPVTRINVSPMPVVQVKTGDTNGYWALKIGISQKKRGNKSEMGQAKGIATNAIPRFLREIRIVDADVTTDSLPKVGETVVASTVLKAGDIVDVVGISKGKGYAGGVKRHGFKGGPRTHGQSDRERAPGSIGQTTTPGRVYKGKRMAGRMGTDKVTIKNLRVVAVSDDSVLLLGLVPGVPNGVILIKKIGEDSKFVPLLADASVIEEAAVEEPQEVAPAEAVEVVEAASSTEAEEVAVKDREEVIEPKADAEVVESVKDDAAEKPVRQAQGEQAGDKGEETGPETVEAEVVSDKANEGEENAGK